MQEKVLKYFNIAKKMKSDNLTGVYIANSLFDEMQKDNRKLSYSIMIKILDKLGYTNLEIVYLVNNSKWSNVERSLEDLFFDAIELDDDLI